MHWHIQQLLIRYGLIAVLLGSAVEGDFSLLLAGVVVAPRHSSRSRWRWRPVRWGASWATPPGTRWGASGAPGSGGEILRAGGSHRSSVWRGQMGPWQLVAARFVYGTKSARAWCSGGCTACRYRRFLLIDPIGCVLGSLVFTGLGYVVSGSATALLGHVKRFELWLLGAFVAGIVVVFIIDRTAKHELHIDHPDKE